MSVGPMCVGDLEVGVNTCAPTHWIGAHGGTGKGVKGAHYLRACQLYSCACVRSCVLDRHSLEHACKLSRRARVRA
jgi:hypothetical protein